MEDVVSHLPRKLDPLGAGTGKREESFRTVSSDPAGRARVCVNPEARPASATLPALEESPQRGDNGSRKERIGTTVAASPIPKASPQPSLKPANQEPAEPKPKLGLRAWMERVLVECDRAAAGFEPDPVHDLRVALRRCRSLADGLMAIDPDSSWKDMKRAGKKLFQALGELRDMQVMQDWIEKLGVATDSTSNPVSADPAAGDPAATRLLDYVRVRE